MNYSDLGFTNQKEVFIGDNVLCWGKYGDCSVLAKNAEALYAEMGRLNSGKLESFNLDSYIGRGYVVVFSSTPGTVAHDWSLVLLIPGEVPEGFKLPQNVIDGFGFDSYVTTDNLVENGHMDVFADVYVSYTSGRNFILPAVWGIVKGAVEYAVDDKISIAFRDSIAMYNDLKYKFPAVDLDNACDVSTDGKEFRYAVVEVTCEKSGAKKNFVFNRNHVAFNGAEARDIIMKPILAWLMNTETDNTEFFLGNTDEASYEVAGEPVPDAESNIEQAMNPPQEPVAGGEPGKTFEEACDFLSMNK